jgi:hypothetical protein
MKAKDAGVEVICDEIFNIQVCGNENLILLSGGGSINSSMLYLPESFELIDVKSIEKIFGPLKKISKTSYWHILIIIYNKINKYNVPEYIHLVDNIYFHRITYDQRNINNFGCQFLIQARFNPMETKYNLRHLISEVLLQARICSENPLFDIKTFYSEDLLASQSDCIFSDAKTYKTITVFPSIGDLARNIAINPFLRSD